MKKIFLFSLLSTACYFAFSQKKPLDHTVYDGWQSIGERKISNDGKWAVYTVDVQEGDNELVIQSTDSILYKKTFDRGYNAVITEDSRFVIFKIKPLYKETREAKIKKKKPDEMPKDSIAIVRLDKMTLWKSAKVKSYKTPQKEAGWVAYQMEKPAETDKSKLLAGDKKTIDSLKRTIDSLVQLIPARKRKKDSDEDIIDTGEWKVESRESSVPGDLTRNPQPATGNYEDADGDEIPGASADAGSDLILRKLETGEEKLFKNVTEYYFDKKAKRLLIETAKNPKDSLSKATVLLHDLRKGITETLSSGGNDFRNFAMTDDGTQIAFTAERDSSTKALQKFHKLWYYKEGMDSAQLLADKNTVGMKVGMTISENGTVSFSKSGKRLFFGTSPVQIAKDTILIDIDKVNIDVWHYKDDYLQPVQLKNLDNELKRNYLAVYHLETGTLKQLASKEMPLVIQSDEGDGDMFAGVTDFGKRIESQWTGNTLKDIYAIDPVTGNKKLVKENLNWQASPSSTGKYILWYDRKARNYFVYDGETETNITKNIKVPLWDEEFDNPDDPPPYGIMGWHEGDSALYVYDKFDIWKVDPSGAKAPAVYSMPYGRQTKSRVRYTRLDPEERFIKYGQSMAFRAFSETDKTSLYHFEENEGNTKVSYKIGEGRYSFNSLQKAKDNAQVIYTKENYNQPADVYAGKINFGEDGINEKKLSAINLQQLNYYWGTAELFKWKAYDGKETEGIVYKPENFSPLQKYPMIAYFYETLSDGLHNYMAPAPTPSRLNIPFFVSRGYVVFAPDIHYGTGHPAKDAYNYIVSGTRALIAKGFIDSTKVGLQGQSWGGIQVAQLITQTNLFKAAWAGAPVANMTSAYGGIRWGTGLNRQFQYEKSQSRIGATLWDKPNLYIENSPLFHLPKVNTPLVIMHNDADDAVPWYQGIELFTGMRRLGKKIWMLNYNGEAHNLVERKNRKDIQIREQQFFDWLLKGEKPAKWITDGVPAVKKGRDWGLEIVD
jgi:dipeptidyl aminopeptidase/acylaminoacyl peptidase